MGTCYSPQIVTNGLRLCTDTTNIKSYPGSGMTITDMVTKGSGTNSIPNASVSWMNGGVNSITLTAIIKRLAANPGYALNPFTKYTNTTDNTFSMYFFGNNGGASPAEDGKIGFYAYRGGAWNTITGQYSMAINETVIAQVQYNSVDGGLMWINGNKIGTRTGSGTLGSSNNTSPLVVYTPPYSSIAQLYYTSIYDRELSDSEILQNYYALRGRYGI